jgi:DNA invertase Pin-like site-specific DNA recombinase
MRVGYARVSTTDQSPELQLDALRRAGCERIHSEKASGAKADRPELTRVLDDVLRRGDVLVVWKLDRLARSLKKLITTAEDLEGRGIGLVSLTESIDTTTPGGVLVFHVFGAIAQFERALIRERTAAGLAEARRRGRKGGRPPAFKAGDITAARALMKEGKLPVRHALPARRQAGCRRRHRGCCRHPCLTVRSGRRARRWSICGGAWRCCRRVTRPAPR